MVSKSVFKILTIWLSFHICAAEEPTFPYPGDDDEFIELQYIVEVQNNSEGKKTKEKLNNGDNGNGNAPKVVRNINSRNIVVVQFPNSNAAENWPEQAKGVKHFEKDPKVHLQGFSPSTPGTTRNLAESVPYGIGSVNAEDVLDSSSSLRKICIIDSGYDTSHEDLPDDPAIVTGMSLVDGDEAWYTDEIRHGTHVAGTIAAIGGNNVGVKGIIRNGEVKLHIVKVFGPSFGPSASVTIAAIEDCVAEGSHVINMSLGGSGRSDAYQDAITAAHEKGVLIFASAGNTGSTGYIYPASYDHVTSVAAVDSNQRHTSFSTYNDQVDISAPGSRVLSTVPGNGYASYSGTSMSSPHAAGVAALVWSNFPTLPAEQLRTILESTATDLPIDVNNGRDNKYGHGLINAKAAYDAVLALQTPPTTASPTPQPTSSPPNSQCKDSPLDMKQAGVWKDCAWAGEYLSRCENANIRSHCPATCLELNCLVDSMKNFKLAGNGLEKTCEWVTMNPEVRCAKEGVKDTCRLGCKDY